MFEYIFLCIGIGFFVVTMLFGILWCLTVGFRWLNRQFRGFW